jgi:hypothetical protein
MSTFFKKEICEIEDIPFENHHFERLTDLCEIEDTNLTAFTQVRCICCGGYQYKYDLSRHQLIKHKAEVTGTTIQVGPRLINFFSHFINFYFYV